MFIYLYDLKIILLLRFYLKLSDYNDLYFLGIYFMLLLKDELDGFDVYYSGTILILQLFKLHSSGLKSLSINLADLIEPSKL